MEHSLTLITPRFGFTMPQGQRAPMASLVHPELCSKVYSFKRVVNVRLDRLTQQLHLYAGHNLPGERVELFSSRQKLKKRQYGCSTGGCGWSALQEARS